MIPLKYTIIDNPIATITKLYSATTSEYRSVLIHTNKLWALAVVICTVMFSSLLFVPFACADVPAELWSFASNTTTNNVAWESGVVADDVAYVWNTETYTIPGEQSQLFFDVSSNTLTWKNLRLKRSKRHQTLELYYNGKYSLFPHARWRSLCFCKRGPKY